MSYRPSEFWAKGAAHRRYIHTLSIRFDRGEAFSEGWVDNTPEEDVFSDEVLAAPNAIPLIRRIAGAERMFVRFVPYNSAPVLLEFDVRGFGEHVGLVADTCNWSVEPT